MFNYLLRVGTFAEILELQVTWLLDVLGSTGKSEERAWLDRAEAAEGRRVGESPVQRGFKLQADNKLSRG